MIMILMMDRLPRMPRREMRAGGMADIQRPVTSPNTEEVTIRGQKLERLRDNVRVRSDVRTLTLRAGTGTGPPR